MLYQTPNPHGGDVYEQNIFLDFSANTNPYGTPLNVMKAIEAALPDVHKYPDPYCRALVRSIAKHNDVDESMVLCGNGAAELIYSYCKALSPKLAAELAPTFSEYSLGLEQAGCRVERYSLREENNFALEDGILDFIKEVQPEVIFLCNPNNPTGQLIRPDLLEKILQLTFSCRTKVFLDECFLDLTSEGRSVKDRLKEFPNLFILRAFTKSYGMAGIRLGYCMTTDAELLGKMAASVQPWNVSSLAQAAGVAALKEQDFLKKALETICEQRPILKEGLESLGFKVIPSSANYLLFKADEDLGEKLRREGIAIRSCDNYHDLCKGWFRTAVKRPEDNRELIKAIKRIQGKE